MKPVFKALSLLGAAALLCLSACSKKPTAEVDNETQSTVDNAMVDQEFMVMLPAIHTVLNKNYYSSYGTICDTLILQSGDANYSAPGHVDPVYALNISSCSFALGDQRVRSGKILVRFTGDPNSVGSNYIIKLQDYRADGISYSCDSIVGTYLSISTSFSLYNFHVQLINGRCQSSSYTIKYNYDRTMNLSIPLSSASVYGTSSGVNRENRAFTVTVDQKTPLKKFRYCKFISQGQLQITPEGFKTRTVDFGNGGCDDDATFSVNSNTLAFKLK